MFRRASAMAARRVAAAVAVTTTTTSPALVAARRWNTTAAPTAADGGRRGNVNRPRAGRRAPMPPAFDVVHWNDSEITKGHLLRVLHRDSFIVLDYHRQTRGAPAEAATAAAGAAGNLNRAERVVTVTLPPVYIARFLGVLEGRMPQVEIQSRFTQATFAPTPGAPPHHYTLQSTPTKPTTGQQQNMDGTDVNEETIDWMVPFDPAESLMLHRFLTQALQYNSGFGRMSS